MEIIPDEFTIKIEAKELRLIYSALVEYADRRGKEDHVEKMQANRLLGDFEDLKEVMEDSRRRDPGAGTE